MAIPLEKEIHRGAFLAGSDWKKFWVDFKYGRLPVLCHYYGLLRHELRLCAQYFSKTKSRAKVECGYGDWLKARKHGRDCPHVGLRLHFFFFLDSR